MDNKIGVEKTKQIVTKSDNSIGIMIVERVMMLYGVIYGCNGFNIGV
jgi:hypothetical protein